MWPIAAVSSIPRRVMNSERWRNPVLVILRSVRSPIKSGARKTKEAYCFTPSTYFVQIREC